MKKKYLAKAAIISALGGGAGEYCSKGSDESSDRKAGCSYCHKMNPYLMSKGSLPKRRLPFVSASSGQYMAFPTNKKAPYIF